jgi:uncharacterized membrane protein YdjX (TVP38/TMEM64 family)
VSFIETYTPGIFDTYEGWTIVIGSILGSFVIYIIAAGIYQIIKRRLEFEEDYQILNEDIEKN